MSASRPDDFDEMVLSARAGRQLHIGDTIALCVQRGGKTYCVSSEGFVELSCSLREDRTAWSQSAVWAVPQLGSCAAQGTPRHGCSS